MDDSLASWGCLRRRLSYSNLGGFSALWDEAGPQTPKSRSRHKKQNNHNPPPTSTPPGRSFSASFLSQQVDRGLDCPSAAANHSQSANSPCARLHPTALSSAESLSSPTFSVTTLSRCPPIRAKRSLICHSFLLFLRGSPHTQGPTPFRAWGRVAEAYYLSCLREDKLSLSRSCWCEPDCVPKTQTIH